MSMAEEADDKLTSHPRHAMLELLLTDTYISGLVSGNVDINDRRWP